MTRRSGVLGRMVLMVDHCAGMLDLVALPVWVGALIAAYQLDPQKAGGLVTLYLLAAVSASAIFAPRSDRLDGKWGAALGFGFASFAFLAAASASSPLELAMLHVAAGFSAGSGLSFTHAAIGRDANPHRLFSVVSMALGIFSAFFLAGVPRLLAAWGAPAMFDAFAAVMAAGCAATLFAFPAVSARPEDHAMARRSPVRLPFTVWLCVAGVSCLALVQSTMFSFIQRLGVDHGIPADRIGLVLISIGALAIFAPALAALLEKRLRARWVMIAGACVQAVLAVVISNTTALAPYAVCGVLLLTVMLFTHSFAFGEIARLDPSGRAVAATPAMLMLGAALGPVLGGTLVKFFGDPALGMAALAIDFVAVTLFLMLLRSRGDTAGAAKLQSSTRKCKSFDTPPETQSL